MNPEFFKTSKHFEAYLKQNEKLLPFYAENIDPDWAKLAERVTSSFTRTDVLKELIRQNTHFKDEQCLKNLELLKEKNTVVVVTGQQLGLLISPLYIIYKTITTLKLAEKLNKEIDEYNFVPVFWLEGEDHDYEEVCKINVPDISGKFTTFQADEKSSENGLSLNKRKLTEDIENLIQELQEVLQETEFSAELFDFLRKNYKKDATWIGAFKTHIAEIFKDSGLLFFSAGTETVKQLSKPFFEKVIVENKSLVSLFETNSAELIKAGYQNQVHVQNDKAYLFLSYENGPRRSLLKKENSFYLKEIEKEYSIDQLLQTLDENPAWFSSTVLTRPLWQSWLLPTVSYVAGGAEIAYWGQLRSAFNHLALPMPHIQPRHSITLIEPRIKRFIEKNKISIHNIPEDKEAFINEYFSQNKLADVKELFSGFEQDAIENREKVKRMIQEIDPTLVNPTEKSYQSILQTIEKLHDRLVNRIKEKEETTKAHLEAIHEAILPNGILQERILSSVYFQNKYGSEWINKIFNALSENFSEHQIVEL
ncbi:MAG: bacillithiol biosynthesis cysteine-adding enzyme BshC [Calditrichaeota bacterium]|nr:bacillithiol biosynthesis cysteine-adding enzyme BshC [Calditrichota bacterium]